MSCTQPYFLSKVAVRKLGVVPFKNLSDFTCTFFSPQNEMQKLIGMLLKK